MTTALCREGSFPNQAVTPEGFQLLIHALRHAWAADDLDDVDREEVLVRALR
jgi:hypothetical protein